MNPRQHSLMVSIFMVIFSGLGVEVPAPEPALAQTGDPVLVGAGDITNCSRTEDDATARLLDGLPGTVFTLGDNAYPDGTLTEFNTCYGPTWGRHKNRTRPAAGNHDYHVAGAAGYYTYFGAAASPLDSNCRSNCRGYYSYNLGAWHIIVLNSEIDHTTGSAQELWLRADLAANPRKCTLAYWHHPRFSSGNHGNKPDVQPFWQALYDYGADVVLSGHDHTYERFAPQTPTGQAASGRGIREFVVGTGGANLYPWGSIQPNSEARNNTTPGVLKLTLHSTSYTWQFIPIAGHSYSDSGSSSCVDAGPVQGPTRPPVAASLVSPIGNISNTRPTFTWNAVLNGAQGDASTWYLLRVRRAGNIQVLNQWYQAANICNGSTCSVQSPVTLTDALHTWEIQTWNPIGYGPWSPPRSFMILFRPGRVSLQSPSGSITDSTPTFSWNIPPDTNTTDPATWYYLWVNGPSGNVIKEWHRATDVCNNTTCSVASNTVLSGAHTWWVQTWNALGYGPWSTGMNFTLPVIPPPGQATLVSPSGSITDTTPTYVWNAVSGAEWYYLWVNAPSGNGYIKQWYDASAVCSGGTCSVTPPTALASGAHTWWIRTWRAGGGYGPWSKMDFSVGP